MQLCSAAHYNGPKLPMTSPRRVVWVTLQTTQLTYEGENATLLGKSTSRLLHSACETSKWTVDLKQLKQAKSVPLF